MIIQIEQWCPTRLRCSIGHEYRGRVRTVRHRAFDMDGEPLWQDPTPQYEPDTCVVCGLKTWTDIPAPVDESLKAEQ
jgi:hypothetical protein